MELLERGKEEQKESEGKLYLPLVSANRKFYEKLVADRVLNNPHAPRCFKRAYQVITEMLPDTLFRPVTPVGQLLWEQHRQAYELGVRHEYRAEAEAKGRQLGWSDEQVKGRRDAHRTLASPGAGAEDAGRDAPAIAGRHGGGLESLLRRIRPVGRCAIHRDVAGLSPPQARVLLLKPATSARPCSSPARGSSA